MWKVRASEKARTPSRRHAEIVLFAPSGEVQHAEERLRSLATRTLPLLRVADGISPRPGTPSYEHPGLTTVV